MNEALDKFTDALAEAVLAKVSPALLTKLQEAISAKQPDPLFTASQAAAYLTSQGSKISDTTIRQLVEAGELHRAPGLMDIRIRRSVLDAYGQPKQRRGN